MKIKYNGKVREITEKTILHTGGKFVKTDIVIYPDGVEVEDDDIL